MEFLYRIRDQYSGELDIELRIEAKDRHEALAKAFVYLSQNNTEFQDYMINWLDTSDIELDCFPFEDLTKIN